MPPISTHWTVETLANSPKAADHQSLHGQTMDQSPPIVADASIDRTASVLG